MLHSGGYSGAFVKEASVSMMEVCIYLCMSLSPGCLLCLRSKHYIIQKCSFSSDEGNVGGAQCSSCSQAFPPLHAYGQD